ASIRPDLPPELCAMVHKMMAKDPAERYQTFKEILREINRLTDVLAGEDVPSLPISGAMPASAGDLTPGLSNAITEAFEMRRGGKWFPRVVIAAAILGLL